MRIFDRPDDAGAQVAQQPQLQHAKDDARDAEREPQQADVVHEAADPGAGSISPNNDGDSHSSAGDSAQADISTTLRRRL